MEHKFYDFNVGSMDEKIIRRAELLDLSGLCLLTNSTENLSQYFDKINSLREKTNLDLITGLLIDESAGNAIKLAKTYRRNFELILVLGGSYETNRAACASEYVDILCCPQRGRMDSGIDHICCREARENNTVIELNFRDLLFSSGMERIREMNKMKEILRLCLKLNTNFIVNSGAKSVSELRGGRELSSLSFCLGASIQDSLLANTELAEKLVLENRKKLNQPLGSVYVDDD